MISRISFNNFQVRAQQRNSNVNFRSADRERSLSKEGHLSTIDLTKIDSGSAEKMTDCPKSNFRYNTIAGVEKEYLNLNSSNFKKCDIENTSLTNCNFYDSKFIGTRFNENVNVSGSKFIKCDFRNADLSGITNWEGADFKNALYNTEKIYHEPVAYSNRENKFSYGEPTKFPEGFDPVAKGMVINNNEFQPNL